MANIMPSKPPVTFPAEQRLLVALGERLRLARQRRGMTTITISQRAGISRTTLHHIETGDAAVTLGAYVRVLAALGLDADLNLLAADDQVGRRLQDLALGRKSTRPRGKRADAQAAR
jgi:transcriptional regulator with XRE-family HTH domain